MQYVTTVGSTTIGVAKHAGVNSWALFKKELPGNKSIMARVMYMVGFLSASGAAFLLRLWLARVMRWAGLFEYVQELGMCEDNDDYCIGAFAAYRVFFALAGMHGLLALALLGVRTEKDPRNSLQNSWWTVKTLGVGTVALGSFFVPYSNVFYMLFSWFALACAGAFVVVQLVLLLELAYTWADSWIARSAESRGYAVLLVVASLALYGAALVITAAIAVVYAFHPDCWFNALFPLINVVAAAAVTLLSVLPRVQDSHPHGTGLLQSGVVSAYAMYLMWSAVMSEPAESGCNVFYRSGSLVSLFIGAVITIAAVGFTTIRTASSRTAQPEPLDATALDSSSSDSDSDEEAAAPLHSPVPYSYFWFHLTFFLGACYMCMLVTNWQTVSGDFGITSSSRSYRVDSGFVSFAVKVATSWLSFLLYTWTLIAPCLFPNRDFS